MAEHWTWEPQSSGVESRIAWGDPATWPPDVSERFIRSGEWVLLDGWSDNGTYYRQRVDSEVIGNGLDCTNRRPLPSDTDGQHYVPWQVPTSIVCLIAEGTITKESTGTVSRFPARTALVSARPVLEFVPPQSAVPKFEDPK
ncbi:hypothetical protein [Saccharopolyspora pogona]|uniref:hypothetical protein n=1 Tax=Saccharopolyspora pogona TaxID=333966 RepID=UPI0016897EEC|nr:hypothetical protein [Saccharopolyspora pogona]